MHTAAAFAGVRSIGRVLLNCGKRIFAKSATEGWTIFNQREDVLDIVEDLGDIPHWWSESTAKAGAYRDPTDHRDHWCWRRCLSDKTRISIRDFYNPDPDTWPDGCDKHIESATLKVLPESMPMKTPDKGEKQGHRTEMEGASIANGNPHWQTNRIVAKSELEAIEECDEAENSTM